MGLESGVVRFDLGPLLQGQTMVHWLWRVVWIQISIRSPIRRSSLYLSVCNKLLTVDYVIETFFGCDVTCILMWVKISTMYIVITN